MKRIDILGVPVTAETLDNQAVIITGRRNAESAAARALSVMRDIAGSSLHAQGELALALAYWTVRRPQFTELIRASECALRDLLPQAFGKDAVAQC